MKKLIILIVAMAMGMGSFAGSLTEADRKLVWQQAYGLERDGWTIQGLGDIEQALAYLTEKQKDGVIIVFGASYGNKKADDAINAAYDNAARQLALSRGYSYREVSSIETDSENADSEPVERVRQIDRLAVEVTASLPVPSLVLLRENDGKYDCMAMYVVDPNH